MQDRIIEIASAVLGAGVEGKTAMKDVPGWDSIKTLQIIMALDEAGIIVPLEKIAKVRSIGDIINFAGTEG